MHPTPQRRPGNRGSFGLRPEVAALILAALIVALVAVAGGIHVDVPVTGPVNVQVGNGR